MNKKAQFQGALSGLICGAILLVMALVALAPFAILIFVVYKVAKKLFKNSKKEEPT
ncbi:MAG: hypothetical protein ABIJ34_07885 [archaeon]